MSGGAGIANTARHRLQKGRLFQKNGAWHCEYYAEIQDAHGAPVWRQTSSTLGRISEHPRRQDIWDTFQGFMDEINYRYCRLRGTDPPVVAFVEETYLKSEHVLALSQSTIDEYRGMWCRYLKARVAGETLGSVRPFTVNKLLETIVREHGVNKYTIGHVKSFLSGLFTFARNHGYFDGANPVAGVKLPKARPKSETYAYSLQEELAIMDALPLMAQAAIATASFAGLSRAEMRGFRWEDRQRGDVYVRRNVWGTAVKDTKNLYRAAPVPIIPQLAEILDEYWELQGRPAEGWVWPASRGNLPVDLNNLFRRCIMEPLKKAGLEWHGWHAFRRGLASNLSELGVPDDVIQKILRHGDLGTTQRFYRKTRNKSVSRAMKKLSRKLGSVSQRKKQRTNNGQRFVKASK